MDPATDQQEEVGAEQSQDQAADPDPGVAEGEVEQEAGADDASDSESDSDDSQELLSRDEIDQLKGDPAKLHKALNTAFTKKTQALAKEREALEPYRDFISQLDEDPTAAVEALAAQLGLRIEGGTKAEVKEQAKTISEAIRQDLVDSLGQEYSDLADKLAPAIEKAAQRVAAQTAEPLMAEQHRIAHEAAVQQSTQDWDSFQKDNPDAKKYEPAMVALSKKLSPGKGMNGREYLSVLYRNAKADAVEGDTARRLVKRINGSSSVDSGGKRVPAREVKTEPTALPTFEQAAADARRGIRYDD